MGGGCRPCGLGGPRLIPPGGLGLHPSHCRHPGSLAQASGKRPLPTVRVFSPSQLVLGAGTSQWVQPSLLSAPGCGQAQHAPRPVPARGPTCGRWDWPVAPPRLTFWLCRHPAVPVPKATSCPVTQATRPYSTRVPRGSLATQACDVCVGRVTVRMVVALSQTSPGLHGPGCLVPEPVPWTTWCAPSWSPSSGRLGPGLPALLPAIPGPPPQPGICGPAASPISCPPPCLHPALASVSALTSPVNSQSLHMAPHAGT